MNTPHIKPETERVAFRESGHAVVAKALGFRVLEISIRPIELVDQLAEFEEMLDCNGKQLTVGSVRDREGYFSLGRTSILPPRLSNAPRSAVLASIALNMVILAGPLTQAHFIDGDYQNFVESAERIDRAYLRTYVNNEKIVRSVAQHTFPIVRTNTKRIKKIVAGLLKNTELWGERLDQMLDGVEPVTLYPPADAV
jgi:hypothetical protein